MAGRSVRVITLGDPNDVACMDGGVRVIAVDPSGQQSQMAPMGPSCQSSLTQVYCGPVETIGLPAPPKIKGSRLDWRITPEGGLEVTVGRPLTKEEEEKRERERCKECKDDKDKDKDKDAKPAAPSGSGTKLPSIDKLKNKICDPLSLLSNKRLPICFETTLGQETAPGLTSVTVINEQPGNPVMVQPRPAPVPSSRGCAPPGVKVICSSDSYGGYPQPTVTTCSGGGGSGKFSAVRIGADSSSSSSMGRRCEQLLPEPCPAMQTIRIMDDGAANRRTSSRVVHIFEEPPAPSRSMRGSSRDRQVSARVVHIEEECPDFP